ncbi:hypothetical protein [Burkholderia lata]|uniref:Putative phage lipoprotein n=1 Tax=Burkholderia lata (strain ATCC 17760 / DSM 23089 / LMG 22485 / NCIMB 9086 / R18194 / 383) TaxID=482957 RepID=A0A6P2LUP3_BURL3|nr:hypothetical protein [Burkholderia lata]VWB70646.1 putative phage lipoprotein [Burkholderia lata]
MKSVFTIILAAVISMAAHAQTFQTNNVNVQGKITFGPATSPANGLTISPTSVYNPALFAGPHAGSAYPITNPWAVGIGAYSLFSINQPEAEVTGVGTLSCARLTTGNYNVCLGLHTLGSTTDTNNSTAVGNDAVRNAAGGNNITAIGANAGRNGSLDQVTAVGAGALRGNGSSVTFGGTITAGHVVQVTATCNAIGACSNSPATWSYTLTGSDTWGTAVSNLVNKINAAPINETPVNGSVLIAMQARAAQLGPTNVLSLDFPGAVSNGWKVSLGVSITGGGPITETYSIGTGVNAPGVVAIGSFAVDGAAAQNLSNSVYIGQGVAPSLNNASENVCIGTQSCFNGQNVVDNTVVGTFAHQANSSGSWNTVIGAFAGQNATGQTNVLVGVNAGQNMTTGSDNTVIGTYTGDTTSKACITTGSGNVQVGRLACVFDPAAQGQLSIQNIIYGYGNNGSGTTPSTGNVGIGVRQPLVKLDIDGPIRAKGYTGATLPGGIIGMRAFVTDAVSCTFGNPTGSGGSLVCPVFFGNSGWVAG